MSTRVSTLRLPMFLVAALVAFADSGKAQNPPWCAILDNDQQQCSYYTQEQCLQTVSGIGGVCIRNPAGNAPQMMPTQPSSENAQGLLQLQQQDPGPPPGLNGSAGQGPPNN
jgi:Protein of unknown function (DUF3551)